jgi:ornithine carbamoyltransferase
MRPTLNRVTQNALKHASAKSYSTEASKVRHLMTIGDLSTAEFAKLVLNAASHKKAVKSGQVPAAIKDKLLGQTVAMMFSKRSTRTRVSTEAAVAMMGGHPMFLGKDDIQLGVSFRECSFLFTSLYLT